MSDKNTDEKLADIDNKIEEMLKENEFLAKEAEDNVTSSFETHPDTIKNLNERRSKRTRKTINQVYTVPENQLDALYVAMLDGENLILEQLLKLLASAIGFNGGMQRFLDVASNQLELGDIKLKKERFDPVMDQVLDIKVLMLLLDTLTEEVDKETLKGLELDLYSRVIHNFFNIAPKDPLPNLLGSLQKSVTGCLKEISFEVSKSNTKQTESNNNFLKKLEHVLKGS